MKLNVKLTADELMDVVDVAMDEAIEQELYFDNFGNENIEKILAVIDAAFTALKIEIIPDEESEAEAEEEDEETEESNLSDAEKRLAEQVFIKISTTYPNIPLEIRAEIAANITARIVAKQRARDGE